MRTLLLVIDMQKGWRHTTATEAAMLKTVALCEKFSGDIIHCCFRNDPASLFHTQLNWRRFVEPRDTEQIPEIAALRLPVYWRSAYSCLDAQTMPIVTAQDHVYIAGVFTDVSVHTTALDIFDARVPVSVVVDCVASLHGQVAHEGALRSLDMALGSRHMVRAASLTATDA